MESQFLADLAHRPTLPMQWRFGVFVAGIVCIIMCTAFQVTWSIAVTSYVVYLFTYITPYMAIKRMPYMYNLFNIFVSAKYMAVTCEVDVAVS